MRFSWENKTHDYEINHLLFLLNIIKMLEYITSFQFLCYVIFMKTEIKSPVEQGGLWLT